MKKIYLLVLLFSIGIKCVYAVNVTNKEITVGVGATQTINVTDALGSISYTSNNTGVATVSNGVVTGVSEGVTYINVIDSYNNTSNTVSCKVTVVNNYVPVSSISLGESSGTIGVNETKKLNVTVSPSNATNKQVTYMSSDSSVASVDGNGIITGKKAGTAYITVTAENRSATYKATIVSNVALNSISISPSSIEINENGTGKLSVNYSPSNATNKKVTWKSSNTDVVTVDGNGNLKGISSGTATITVVANDGGKVATAKVIVNAIDRTLKGISLNKSELTLKVGSSETLTVTYNPNNAENKDVSWRSSDSTIVSVSDGKITANKPGTVTIMVTSDEGSYTAKCTVRVPSPPIESIKFAKEEQVVNMGTTPKLEMIAVPENAIIEDAIWTSSDEDVATVEDGVVTPIKLGKTTITVSSKDGKIKASTEVTVEAALENDLSITIEGYDLKFDPDKTEYTLLIGEETSLKITVNRGSNKVSITGNKNLENGSVITIVVNDGEKVVYHINIKKKVSYVIYFIGAITVLLIINIIRILVKGKKKKNI